MPPVPPRALCKTKMRVDLCALIVLLSAVLAIVVQEQALRHAETKHLLPLDNIHSRGNHDRRSTLQTTPSPPVSFEPLPDVLVSDGCTAYERHVDQIQLHVIGWQRAESLQTLLEQLRNATYQGWESSVPLFIHLDGGASDDVAAYTHSFEWPHGPLHVDARTESNGLRGMWLTALGDAAQEAGDNSLMLCFEDDMRVSKHYFQWLLRVIDAYGRHPHCRDANLVGISLSPNKIDEMKKPFTRWYANKSPAMIVNNNNGTTTTTSHHSAYLSLLPGSWGAAYWTDRWKEFMDFVDVRMKPPFYDLQEEERAQPGHYDELQLSPQELFVPGARSNVWPKSWKRFMVDFMYARGTLFLYPNLPEERALATTMTLTGEHVSKKVNSNYVNPRIAELANSIDDIQSSTLPKYSELPVLDLWLQPSSREQVLLDGAKFLRSVHTDCTHDCKELLDSWSLPGPLQAIRSDQGGKEPPICLPDLYMPSSALRHKPSSDNRYLLMEPQYGANNQIFGIVHGMYWAMVLERQLVIPPVFIPRVRDFEAIPVEEWPSTNEVLQFTMEETKVHGLGYKAPKPPIEFREWKKLNLSPHRVLRVTHDATWDKMSWTLMDEMQNSASRRGNSVEVDLRDVFAGKPKASRMYRLLGGCEDEVLAFQSLFMTKLIGFDKYTAANHVVSLSPGARSTFNALKELLFKEFGSSSYNCMHIRGDDFNDMCPAIENSTSEIFIYDKLSSDGYACRSTPEQIHQTMQSLGRPTLVMSDNTTEIVDLLDSSPVPVVSSDWVRKNVQALSPGSNQATRELLSLVLEQELCFEAEVSVLNVFSTYSKRIRYRRTGGRTEHTKNEHGETVHWMKDPSQMFGKKYS